MYFLRDKMGFQCWLSFLGFHESQPKGILLTHCRDILSEEGLPAAMVGSERLCRESLAMLIDGVADESLEEALQGNPNMNGEDLLSTAALESCFMWKRIKELRAGEERERLVAEASAATPAASVDPAPVAAQVDGQSGASSSAAEGGASRGGGGSGGPEGILEKVFPGSHPSGVHGRDTVGEGRGGACEAPPVRLCTLSGSRLKWDIIEGRGLWDL